MTWELHRHDARRVSDLLEPESVDLIVTSPPYWALRSYQDACGGCNGAGVASKPTATHYCPECKGTGRVHYDGQIGSEPTPGEFVDALIECTRDWMRVLKPTGSMAINLGDKYANAAPSGTAGYIGAGAGGQWDDVSDTLPTIRSDRAGIPAKSLMGLPWRYALRCIDELGLILRAEIVWSKPNGLPESVTDRVRRSHEQWFHFTRQGRYFAAIDEVREAQDYPNHPQIGQANHLSTKRREVGDETFTYAASSSVRTINPLGKVPGSVWSVPSEPLVVPESLGVDHFAAFPSELPRRIILGWSPSGYCTVCDEPRRAVVDTTIVPTQIERQAGTRQPVGGELGHNGGHARPGYTIGRTEATITGYVCACLCYSCRNGGAPTCGHVMDDAPPTRPAVVLDPFAGTGTTVAVAHLLGRHGIGTDLSRDYLKLAEWRCTSDRRLRDKVLDRTGIPNPDPPAIDGQLDLFEGIA